MAKRNRTVLIGLKRVPIQDTEWYMYIPGDGTWGLPRSLKPTATLAQAKTAGRQMLHLSRLPNGTQFARRVVR